MSLILDALKRSEAERRAANGKASTSLPGPPRRPRRTGYALAALAVALVVAAAWRFDWLADGGDHAPTQASDATPVLTQEATTPPLERSREEEKPEAVAEGSEPSTVVSVPPEEPFLVEPEAFVPDPASEPERPAEAADRYLPIETLQDDAAREWIRGMTVNMHVFAPEPENRFVLINLQRREQGDTLEDGIRLLEITAEGMVLGINGRQYLWRSR